MCARIVVDTANLRNLKVVGSDACGKKFTLLRFRETDCARRIPQTQSHAGRPTDSDRLSLRVLIRGEANRSVAKPQNAQVVDLSQSTRQKVLRARLNGTAGKHFPFLLPGLVPGCVYLMIYPFPPAVIDLGISDTAWSLSLKLKHHEKKIFLPAAKLACARNMRACEPHIHIGAVRVSHRISPLLSRALIESSCSLEGMLHLRSHHLMENSESNVQKSKRQCP